MGMTGVTGEDKEEKRKEEEEKENVSPLRDKRTNKQGKIELLSQLTMEDRDEQLIRLNKTLI